MCVSVCVSVCVCVRTYICCYTILIQQRIIRSYIMI